MTNQPDTPATQEPDDAIKGAASFIDTIIESINPMLESHGLHVSWKLSRDINDTVQLQFILDGPAEEAREAADIDDDLGELDATKACSVDNPECESCQ